MIRPFNANRSAGCRTIASRARSHTVRSADRSLSRRASPISKPVASSQSRGSTGPFVAALLVSVTGNPLSPGFYLVAVMLIVGVIVALFLPETKDVDLHYEAVERAEQAVGSSV